MSSLSLDTSDEAELSHTIRGGLLDFGDSWGDIDDPVLTGEYFKYITGGKDLSRPVKLSSSSNINARMVGKNAFIISTPRKLFSFSRKEIYQHYLGSIYRIAHNSPSKPRNVGATPRRKTFEPTPTSSQSPAQDSPGKKKSMQIGSFSPDARRERSRTMNDEQRVASNRTLLEVGFSPYVNAPGSPTSPLEHRLGDILRHCDEGAIERMLAMADACPDPEEGDDETKRELIKSVRSLQTLAEVKRKKERKQEESDEKYMLTDELKYLCKKRISALSYRRDWKGEKALRDFRYSNGQMKIKLPHRKIFPVSTGIPQPSSRARRKRDNSGAIENSLVSPIAPHRPLAAHAPDIERVVVPIQPARDEPIVDPHEAGLLTTSQLIDINEDSCNFSDDRLPATAEFDSGVLDDMCSDLIDTSNYLSENGEKGAGVVVIPEVFDDDVLDEMCDILNDELDNKNSDRVPGVGKKQFGRIEFNKFGNSKQRQWAPLRSSSRPSTARPKSSKKIRPHSAAPASAGQFPSAFPVGKMATEQKLFPVPRAYSSPEEQGGNRFLASKGGPLQPGGNGVVYRGEYKGSTLRKTVEVHSPVKFWAKS